MLEAKAVIHPIHLWPHLEPNVGHYMVAISTSFASTLNIHDHSKEHYATELYENQQLLTAMQAFLTRS